MRAVGEGELSFAGSTSVLTPQKRWESSREGGLTRVMGARGARGKFRGTFLFLRVERQNQKL